MTTKGKIKNLIKKAFREFEEEKRRITHFKMPGIFLEKPKRKEHGDYATNIGMILAKEIKENPIEIAEMIGVGIKRQKSRILKEVKIMKPGFINFWLAEGYLQKEIKEILRKDKDFGKLNLGRNKKVQVEFISANPTGPLTVGNARGGPFGDALANILEKAGYRVKRAYYINDYGEQIKILGHSVLKDEKAQYRGDYIEKLHKRIKGKDPLKVGQIAAQEIMKMIKKTTDKLGIKYDEWIWESWLHQKSTVDKVIKLLEKKGLIYKKEGALWFRSSKFKDERDRVLVKKDGSKTYLAGDLALHQYKFGTKKFQKVIDILGADHQGDVPGLQAGVTALGYKGKLDIILLQFVTIFKEGKPLKMSKRRGIFITMDQLLEEVGRDAVRFFFLEKSANTHLNFDLDLAKEQSEKNPVYYIQYAHARICSILNKAKEKEIKFERKVNGLKLLNHPQELNLMRELIRFPEIIEDTSRDYQVQRLPQYGLELAEAFHGFYRDCKVLINEERLRLARLALILATKIVLQNTLALMGISAPEKM